MRRTFILILTVLCLSTYAQKTATAVNEYAAIDKKALQVPDSMTSSTDGIARYMTQTFTTDKDKVRGIWIWIATNIAYDLPNMFAINFYESRTDKINKALLTKQGICESYATLFEDICKKSGIRAVVIEGYTKQNGFTDYIPHAWAAAMIDTTWYLFDPTWGSGYVNNGKFYKKINNYYFKTSPGNLIRSHMPFDYLWQLLEYPVNGDEFYAGKVQPNKSKPYFNYKDSVNAYEQLPKSAQWQAVERRIMQNGIKNSMVYDRLAHIKVDIENDKRQKENDRQNKIVNLYNSAVNSYNIGINDLNAFIDYRNHQFTPMKSDPDIQAMLDEVEGRLNKAKAKLDSITAPDASFSANLTQLNKGISDVRTQLKDQQEFLKAYFPKNKSKRKAMFYERKITWFGVPLN